MRQVGNSHGPIPVKNVGKPVPAAGIKSAVSARMANRRVWEILSCLTLAGCSGNNCQYIEHIDDRPPALPDVTRMTVHRAPWGSIQEVPSQSALTIQGAPYSMEPFATLRIELPTDDIIEIPADAQGRIPETSFDASDAPAYRLGVRDGAGNLSDTTVASERGIWTASLVGRRRQDDGFSPHAVYVTPRATPGLYADQEASQLDIDRMATEDGGWARIEAQVTWRQPDVANPAINFERHGAVAYDLARNQLLRFSDRDGSGFLHIWKNGAWHASTRGPPGLRRPAMAYDPRFDRMVVFGNDRNTEDSFGKTYVFSRNRNSDEGIWEEIFPSCGRSGIAPPPRTQHTMVYDEAREEILLFGGKHSRTVCRTPGDLMAANGRKLPPRPPQAPTIFT